jgi:CheY-like chemotaxis protein
MRTAVQTPPSPYSVSSNCTGRYPRVRAAPPSAIDGFLLNLVGNRSFSTTVAMKVLLVDDNKAMRVMVRRALLQTGLQGLHVEEAENGSDALEKLALQLPDLILSDWSMPEMTGIELLRELRARGCAVKRSRPERSSCWPSPSTSSTFATC